MPLNLTEHNELSLELDPKYHAFNRTIMTAAHLDCDTSAASSAVDQRNTYDT